MSGHTDNSVFIAASRENVWRVANDVANWPQLFVNEYSAAEVLYRDEHRIAFRLTTMPENGTTHSWQSERFLDSEKFRVSARRAGEFPFVYMHIFQSFDAVDGGTMLRWVQDFEVAPGAPFDTEQITERINRNSAQQLARHKSYLEAAQADALTG